MKTNAIIRDGRTPNLALYATLLDAVQGVPGDVVEFGVHRGDTFAIIWQKAAAVMGRNAHAVDSFRGMPRPAAPGDELYPEGMFDVGGTAEFARRFPDAFIHEGFVPDILGRMPSMAIAFAHVDLDHLLPTRDAIDWAWERMSDGGILACHDFRFGQEVRAASAVSAWMREAGVRHVGLSDLTIWFRKGTE